MLVSYAVGVTSSMRFCQPVKATVNDDCIKKSAINLICVNCGCILMLIQEAANSYGYQPRINTGMQNASPGHAHPSHQPPQVIDLLPFATRKGPYGGQ